MSREHNPILGLFVCKFISWIYFQNTHSWMLPHSFLLLLLPSFVESGPPQYYVSLSQSQPKSVTTFVKYILANMTGTATRLNQSQCQNPKDISGESKDVRLHLVKWIYLSTLKLSESCKFHCLCTCLYQCHKGNTLYEYRKIEHHSGPSKSHKMGGDWVFGSYLIMCCN